MRRLDYDDEPAVIIERHSGGVGSFLLGVTIGAVAALLLAPQSGEATRRDLRRGARRARRAAQNMAGDLGTKVSDTFEQARDRVEHGIDTARQAIDLKKRQVTRAMVAAGTLIRFSSRRHLGQKSGLRSFTPQQASTRKPSTPKSRTQ